MGALQSISSLMFIVAPLIGTTLLGRTSHLPANDWRVGGTFFLCAAFQLLALVLALRHFRGVQREAAVKLLAEFDAALPSEPHWN